MILYHSPLSPYVRKVVVTAQETGQLGDIEQVNGSGTPLDPNTETLSVNPLGKIPCLITDSGEAIFDSRVICRYLDIRSGAGLYPAGELGIAVQTREALAEGMIDAALMVAYEGRLRPEELRFAPWVEGQKDKVRRGAEAFEARIAEMTGPVRADQIALGCALGYIDFRVPDLGWRSSCPALSDWYETFSARPSMQATIPS